MTGQNQMERRENCLMYQKCLLLAGRRKLVWRKALRKSMNGMLGVVVRRLFRGPSLHLANLKSNRRGRVFSFDRFLFFCYNAVQ